LLRIPPQRTDDGGLHPEHHRQRRSRRLRSCHECRDFPDHLVVRRHLRHLHAGDRGMTTAAETTAGAVRPVSRSVRLRRSPLGRFRFRGKSFVLYLMLSMTIFPQIAILGALYTMFSGFHIVGPIHFPKLYDTPWALVFSYLIFTLPFTIWVLTSFMRALPGDL